MFSLESTPVIKKTIDGPSHEKRRVFETRVTVKVLSLLQQIYMLFVVLFIFIGSIHMNFGGDKQTLYIGWYLDSSNAKKQTQIAIIDYQKLEFIQTSNLT